MLLLLLLLLWPQVGQLEQPLEWWLGRSPHPSHHPPQQPVSDRHTMAGCLAAQAAALAAVVVPCSTQRPIYETTPHHTHALQLVQGPLLQRMACVAVHVTPCGFKQLSQPDCLPPPSRFNEGWW